MVVIGLDRKDLIEIIKTVGQNIIDNAEDIAPDSYATNSVRIVGEIVAGEVVKLGWTVWKHVVDEDAVVVAHMGEIEVE